MRFLAVIAAVVLAVAPAVAVVPPLPDADRSASFAVSAPQTVFGVPFAVYGDCTDLDVFENGTLQSPLNYTCASASGSTNRPITDMLITLGVPFANGTLTINGDYRPRNLVMPTAPGVTRYEFNRTINTILSGMRETRTLAEKSVPPTIYGFWSPTSFYPPNAVVGYGGQLWQATQQSINQLPVAGSAFWQVVPSPPQQLTFVTPNLPGAPNPIMAAPTVDLGTVPTHFVSITGSGAISSFGSSCSATTPIYYVTFAGADTLVNGQGINLPGGANVATQANDTLVAQCLGGGNWQVLSYSPFATAPGFTVPSGMLAPFASGVCPGGWIAANGQNNTVDARGVAIRGLDSGRGLDPGRVNATYQADQIQQFTVTTTVSAGGNTGGLQSGNTGNDAAQPYGGNYPGVVAGANFGAETRMKNVALVYCQKL